MPNKTQSDCAKEWKELKEFVIKRIKEIDDDTPAEPYTEPAWWMEMILAGRYLRRPECYVENQHT